MKYFKGFESVFMEKYLERNREKNNEGKQLFV